MKYRIVAGLLLLAGFVTVLSLIVHGHTIAVLDPHGPIAARQLSLIIFGSLLAILVIVPVFVLTATIAWKYRASNPKGTYTPDWDHNWVAETIWWLIPLAIITVLSVVAWNTSHELDPARPIVSSRPPLEIQVIALDWKWLFIYPQQGIASVNYVQFPTGTPVAFRITADAPMNSFWIPQLGGQIYAMPGMTTQLHLMADRDGSYAGSSANLSGDGFAGMRFTAHASSNSDFGKWVAKVKASSQTLDDAAYTKLTAASKNNPVSTYGAVKQSLYDEVVMKYMSADATQPGMKM